MKRSSKSKKLILDSNVSKHKNIYAIKRTNLKRINANLDNYNINFVGRKRINKQNVLDRILNKYGSFMKSRYKALENVELKRLIQLKPIFKRKLLSKRKRLIELKRLIKRKRSIKPQRVEKQKHIITWKNFVKKAYGIPAKPISDVKNPHKRGSVL